jgi:hypothetical protein
MEKFASSHTVVDGISIVYMSVTAEGLMGRYLNMRRYDVDSPACVHCA